MKSPVGMMKIKRTDYLIETVDVVVADASRADIIFSVAVARICKRLSKS